MLCSFIAHYRSFGTMYLSSFKDQSWSLNLISMCWPKTPVTNYQSTLRKIQGGRRSKQIQISVRMWIWRIQRLLLKLSATCSLCYDLSEDVGRLGISACWFLVLCHSKVFYFLSFQCPAVSDTLQTSNTKSMNKALRRTASWPPIQCRYELH
jgi:hypothetical protein